MRSPAFLIESSLAARQLQNQFFCMTRLHGTSISSRKNSAEDASTNAILKASRLPWVYVFFFRKLIRICLQDEHTPILVYYHVFVSE